MTACMWAWWPPTRRRVIRAGKNIAGTPGLEAGFEELHDAGGGRGGAGVEALAQVGGELLAVGDGLLALGVAGRARLVDARLVGEVGLLLGVGEHGLGLAAGVGDDGLGLLLGGADLAVGLGL